MMLVGKAFSHKFLLLSVLIGLLVSGLSGAMLYYKELDAIGVDFRLGVEDKATALERELLANLEVLFALDSLFTNSDEVTASDFANLASGLLARNPNIQALEWAPRILDAQRKEYEQSRRLDFPDFEFTERESQGSMVKAARRDIYFPVYYVAPHKGNEVALGFDLASNENRLNMIERSRDLDLTLATQSITLVQDISVQKGFLILMPVYEGDPKTVVKRQEKLLGIVLGVYRIADIVESAVKQTGAKGINLKLIDNTSLDAELLYANYPSAQMLDHLQLSFAYTIPLRRIGGRQWTLIATPCQGYVAERQSLLPFIVSVFGCIFVLAGGGYIFMAIEHSVRIREESLVHSRELEEAKLALEERSLTDNLTKTANRKCFELRFEEEWLRAIRDGSSLSLIMIDIDDFSLFNEAYGHTSGDQCLRDLGHKLIKVVNRTTDLVARYGGDKFVILLPNTDEPILLADKCRINIEKLHIAHKTSSVSDYVSISLGVISVMPAQQNFPEDCIYQVKELLHQSKTLGKNRVSIGRDIISAKKGDILKFKHFPKHSAE
jgi:diguanylate cyclase (GGDEF)-like protein